MRSPAEHRADTRPPLPSEAGDGAPLDAAALPETIRERVLQAGLWLGLIVVALGISVLGVQFGLDPAARGGVVAAAVAAALLFVALTLVRLAHDIVRSADRAGQIAAAIAEGPAAAAHGRTGLLVRVSL